MSNFYNDFLFEKEQIPILLKAYKGAFNLLLHQIKEVEMNKNIKTMLTYRNIQYQRLDVTKILYSINDIVNNLEIMTAMGMSNQTAYSTRVSKWEALTLEDKAKYLDLGGFSLQLNSAIHFGDIGTDLSAKYEIINFDLCDIYNEPLEINIDYAFFDNKLVLLKSFPLDDYYKRKFLIMKNINIDINTIEDNLGEPLNIPYSSQFTKIDYTEALKAFTKAAAGGPTLSNLTDALTKYKLLESMKIYDKHNAQGSRKQLWSYDNGKFAEYTDFDFLVSLPTEFINKADKLEYIKRFFDIIKPSYTAYNLIPEIIFNEDLGANIIFNENYKSSLSKNISENVVMDEHFGDAKSKGIALTKKQVDSFTTESQIAKFDKIECVCDSCVPFVADETYEDKTNVISESIGVKLIKK